LAREFFSDSAGLFLLIKRVGQRRVGGFFLCEEGHVDPKCSLMFPFNRSQLTRGETKLSGLPEQEEEVAPLAPPPAYAAPGSRDLEFEDFHLEPNESQPDLVWSDPPSLAGAQPEGSRWKVWAGMFLLVTLIVTVGVTGYQLFRSSSVLQPQSASVNTGGLGLKVEMNGDSLRVSRNKDSASIGSARKGVLSIRDGSSRRDLNLGADQLRTGKRSFFSSQWGSRSAAGHRREGRDERIGPCDSGRESHL
jgi:hypothetical protein